MNSLAMPQVAISNDILTTTSRNISDVFGKMHKHVIRDIEDLEIPGDFAKSNFGLCSYKGKNNQSYKMYNITQDGFTLLVMGYVGKKAMQFKLAYIEAFNKMHKELLNSYKQHALPATITPKQQKQLHDAVTKKVYAEYPNTRAGLSKGFSAEWNRLKDEFGVAKYEQIPSSEHESAMCFVVGEWVPEEPKLAIADDKIVVSRDNLKALVKLSNLAAEGYKQVLDVEEKVKLAESAAADAREAMCKFRAGTFDAVRDAKFVALTFRKDLD